jgi:hypothetical protein
MLGVGAFVRNFGVKRNLLRKVDKPFAICPPSNR